MRELGGLGTDECFGVLRMIVHDVVFDLGHVDETQLAVWALMDDHSKGHGSMVTPGPAEGEGTLVPRRNPNRPGFLIPNSSSTEREVELRRW